MKEGRKKPAMNFHKRGSWESEGGGLHFIRPIPRDCRWLPMACNRRVALIRSARGEREEGTVGTRLKVVALPCTVACGLRAPRF